MTSRTYSTECSDDDNNNDDFNTAMRLSGGENSVTSKTVSRSQYRTKYDFGHSSLEKIVNSEESTTFILSVKEKLRRHLEEGSSQTFQGASQSQQGKNKASSISVNTELKVKADKPNITSDIILPVPLLSKSSKNWETVEELTADNLDESNIWPALSTLELNYSQNDGDISTDHRVIIEKLNQQFNYSPRKFTESLMTIIEESFLLPDESADGLLEFVHKSQNIKQLEDESIPASMLTASSSNVENISLLSSMSEAENNEKNDSTQYMSYRKKASPSLNKKQYRQTPKKNSRKTPKISVLQCLRVGSNKSPKDVNKTFMKTPKIVINPGTPQARGNQCQGHRDAIQSCDDDNYLTAESETEESEPISIESEEPEASSSMKMDMSRFRVLHEQWTQAYKKVEKSSSSKITDSKRKLASHSTKLEKRLLSELQQKRQKCFDLIEQLIAKNSSDALSNQYKSDCSCTPCHLNTEFFNILQVCSDYYAYGMNARDVYQSVAKNNLNKGPSSHVSAQHVKSKSPRKSLSRANVRVKSPAARWLSPYAKSGPKRRSLKRRASPIIDKSSIRPVAELRNVFSPGLRAAAGRKPNAIVVHSMPRPTVKVSKPVPIRSPEVTPRKVGGSGSRKFRHVVSPIALYIKGKKSNL